MFPGSLWYPWYPSACSQPEKPCRKASACGSLQQPVGHRLPGQLQALTVEFLFQPVQRRVHDEFLCCQICHCLRRDKAAWQQRRLFRCLYNVGLAGLLLAVLAGVGVVYVLADPELRRLHLQRPANLFADLNQFAAAGRADPLILWQTVLYHLGMSPLRNDVQHIAGLPLARMRPHLNKLLRGGFGSGNIGLLVVVKLSCSMTSCSACSEERPNSFFLDSFSCSSSHSFCNVRLVMTWACSCSRVASFASSLACSASSLMRSASRLTRVDSICAFSCGAVHIPHGKWSPFRPCCLSDFLCFP